MASRGQEEKGPIERGIDIFFFLTGRKIWEGALI